MKYRVTRAYADRKVGDILDTKEQVKSPDNTTTTDLPWITDIVALELGALKEVSEGEWCEHTRHQGPASSGWLIVNGEVFDGFGWRFCPICGAHLPMWESRPIEYGELKPTGRQ